MGITFKEFAWLVEPERINKNFLFGGVMGCPGDIVNGECVLIKCNKVSMHRCIECWNRKIPYPVIGEAVRDTRSYTGRIILKGEKFKVVMVNMNAGNDFSISLDISGIRQCFKKDDFKFYIQKEEQKMSKFKIGDKVRIKKFKTRPVHWNENGKMDKYAGKVVTISHIYGYGGIGIYEDNHMWSWKESDFAPAEFTKNDLEDGMMAELRDGSKMIWLYGALRNTNYWCSVTNEDLTGAYEKNDIVKVGYPEIKNELFNIGNIRGILKSEFSVILWERQEEKEISSEEAFAVLKEHYGCDVKIKE